jgi:hypothetical protein
MPRCEAITKLGTRCKNTGEKDSKSKMVLCHAHRSAKMSKAVPSAENNDHKATTRPDSKPKKEIALKLDDLVSLIQTITQYLKPLMTIKKKGGTAPFLQTECYPVPYINMELEIAFKENDPSYVEHGIRLGHTQIVDYRRFSYRSIKEMKHYLLEKPRSGVSMSHPSALLNPVKVSVLKTLLPNIPTNELFIRFSPSQFREPSLQRVLKEIKESFRMNLLTRGMRVKFIGYDRRWEHGSKEIKVV